MPTPSDLTQSGQTLILGLVNAANTTPENGPATAENVTFGVPAASGATPNTNLTLTAVTGQGYSGDQQFSYNRLNIQSDVFAVIAPDGATLPNNSYTTVADLIAPINAAYNINLQAEDVANGADELSLVNQAGSATITIAAGSLVYLGSLDVAITQPQVPLATAFPNTTLDGLTAPAAPSPSPSP